MGTGEGLTADEDESLEVTGHDVLLTGETGR